VWSREVLNFNRCAPSNCEVPISQKVQLDMGVKTGNYACLQPWGSSEILSAGQSSHTILLFQPIALIPWGSCTLDLFEQLKFRSSSFSDFYTHTRVHGFSQQDSLKTLEDGR
jgi:hypothetical protein